MIYLHLFQLIERKIPLLKKR